MNAGNRDPGAGGVGFFQKINDEPKVLFESLPAELRGQYHQSPVVHMYVSAFIYGKIRREEMMEKLCVALVEQNKYMTNRLEQFVAWFGAPSFRVVEG